MPIKCILTEQGGKGGGGSVVLQSIAIKNPPTKTTYVSGDTFSTDGMVVEATYVIGSAPIATTEITGYSVSPTTMTDGITSVTITFSEGGVTCTATQPVTVIEGLRSLEITSPPTKTSYEYGDTLATAGLVVTGHYSDGSNKTITGYTCSPTTLNTVTPTQVVTVSFTENGITETATFNVVVERKSVAKPTWKSNLTYNGSSQSVSGTTLWNNYDTTAMTIAGTTSATNAGSYTATFKLRDNYRWTDGTITDLDVDWVINKKQGTSSLSVSSITVDGNNLTKTATVNGEFDGTVSITPATVTGLTLAVSGKTISVTGDGNTTVTSTAITVKVSEGTNYLAPANLTLTVAAQYWSFGAGTGETADAAWFASLKNYLASNTGASIKTTSGGEILGATKTVTLTSAVLGTTTHLIQVIGVDQDGTGTVTWQTQNCLAETTAFGNSVVWIGSKARTQCQNYYNAFPGKASIKTVKKGTCPDQVSGKNGTATYNDETVWLPSEAEMGLESVSSLAYSNSTTSNAECTQGLLFKYALYTDNTSRVKKLGDSDSAQHYWDRSRHFNDAIRVCQVAATGGPGGYNYNFSSGLAPAFVIG